MSNTHEIKYINLYDAISFLSEEDFDSVREELSSSFTWGDTSLSLVSKSEFINAISDSEIRQSLIHAFFLLDGNVFINLNG